MGIVPRFATSGQGLVAIVGDTTQCDHMLLPVVCKLFLAKTVAVYEHTDTLATDVVRQHHIGSAQLVQIGRLVMVVGMTNKYNIFVAARYIVQQQKVYLLVANRTNY